LIPPSKTRLTVCIESIFRQISSKYYVVEVPHHSAYQYSRKPRSGDRTESQTGDIIFAGLSDIKDNGAIAGGDYVLINIRKRIQTVWSLEISVRVT